MTELVGSALVDNADMNTAKALDEGEGVLEGLQTQLADNSVNGGDVITVEGAGKDGGDLEFNADSAAAGFLVGQIAQRVQQGLTTAVAPATAKDGIAKMVSQKT